MTAWRTVPITPDARMRIAFAAEIRRQSALLLPGSTAHEPLDPLWAAVLSVAPHAPPRLEVPGSASAAYAAGVRDVLALARLTADRIEARTRRPLAEGFAIEALRGLAEAAEALIQGDAASGNSAGTDGGARP